MAWQIELSNLAQKNLASLDRQQAKRILIFLNSRVSNLSDPRSVGEALQGARLGNLWKYRVGDYRIIADIKDDRLCVVVVKIGNRKEVYRSNGSI